MGTLTIALAIWLCFQERAWLKWMGLGAVVLVVLQGVVGGLRVIWHLDWLGVPHAALAQSFFIYTVAHRPLHLALVDRTAAGIDSAEMDGAHHGRLRADLSASCSSARPCGTSTPGFPSPTFPLAYGQVWPKTDPASMDAYTTCSGSIHNAYATTAFSINLQMAHRVGAVLVTLGILATAAGDVADARHGADSAALERGLGRPRFRANPAGRLHDLDE